MRASLVLPQIIVSPQILTYKGRTGGFVEGKDMSLANYFLARCARRRAARLVAVPRVRRVFRTSFVVLRLPAARLPARTIFLVPRSSLFTTSRLVSAFCAASALAAMVPRVDPIDSATAKSSGACFLEELRVRVVFTVAPFMSKTQDQHSGSMRLLDHHGGVFRSCASRRVTTARTPGSLDRSATLNDPDQNHDDRQDQQDVHESAQGVGRDQAQQPQDHQDYRDGPKQIHSSLLLRLIFPDSSPGSRANPYSC